MQFKHPEILWALLLLIIPILVHLLQLRKFKKTAFTNVAMLQKVVSESKKSQQLKKWLLLACRLLLLAALVLAFAQPFTAKPGALAKRETVIYLDNSLSMQAQKEGATLFAKAVQDLVQQLPAESNFSLFTNDKTFAQTNIKELSNALLSLQPSATQLDFDQILLKANSTFSQGTNRIKDLVILSDLQGRSLPNGNLGADTQLHLVQNLPTNRNNVYIDSLFLGKPEGNQISLNVQVVGLKEEETTPLSLYNGNKLLAKTAVTGNKATKALGVLSLKKGMPIKGQVVITDEVLRFDNHLYFNIDQRAKPKVLAINEADGNFLKRIYTDQDFDYTSYTTGNLNYGQLENQHTIILNGLTKIPPSLSKVLVAFYNNGGSLAIIPPRENLDTASYNQLLTVVADLRFGAKITREERISEITFGHPLFANVFNKEVSNFDYPKVNTSYAIKGNRATALALESGAPFVVSAGNCYVFTASLAEENANFIHSPLIVPTFYNIGENSLKTPNLYQTIGTANFTDILAKMEGDHILKLYLKNETFIPRQQLMANKIRLFFDNNPTKEGTYALLKNKDTLQHLSFNQNRKESLLNYLEGNSIKGAQQYSQIPDLFKQLNEATALSDYWKWFVIFAMLFAVLEILIQKLFR